ncbi:MAG: putative zinc-binding protein [Candidatus Thorarchaeota archaeon]
MGNFNLDVTETNQTCPTGQEIGKENIEGNKIPVFSCEGGCIRGEIARVAANIVGRQEPYRRGCHGELFTVPHSEIANWNMKAEKVVLIDGCFLKCHGRIAENIFDKDKLMHFDALSHYKKYTDLFYIDEVPEVERNAVAQDVANWVLESMKNK